MTGAVEHFDVSTHHDVVANRDLAPYGEGTIVANSDVIADSKCRLVCVTDGKDKAALPVNVDVISDYQATTPHDPMNERSGMHITSVFGAVRLKKGLAYKNAGTEIVEVAQG